MSLIFKKVNLSIYINPKLSLNKGLIKILKRTLICVDSHIINLITTQPPNFSITTKQQENTRK